MKSIFIFDIDGTLSNPAHRLHYLDIQPDGSNGKNKNWKKFLSSASLDSIIPGMCVLMATLFYSGFKIILLTGRSENERQLTETWLGENLLQYDQLIMRPAKSNEPDTTLKLNLLQKHLTDLERMNIATIFEDRTRVVTALRDEGYHVCQVAQGDF